MPRDNGGGATFLAKVSGTDICSGQVIEKMIGLAVSSSYSTLRPGETPPQKLEAAPELSIYPNPVDDQLMVRLQTTPEAGGLVGTGKAQLYNGQGLLVRELTITGTSFVLPTANLPAGAYYLVVNQNGHARRQHIEVQH
jgi:hypothetical protein